METSSAETGSSAIIISGSVANDLAIPIRCLCPPENSLNKFEKENLYKKASKELTQINEEFFEIIWPIAISRSHSLPDKKDEASQSDLKIARLKTLYGN